ncbi:hypothetical protein Tco_1470582, partial [Tanacetum coccineum]
DDPIDAINHMMSFLTAVITFRYPTTNNQLRNSSNPRQQATINNGRVTLQLIQGRRTSLPLGEGHMSKQCTKPKRKWDDSWFKDKVLLVQAQATGLLDYDELNTAKVALMANLSHYGLDALAEVHNHDNMNNNMLNQVVEAMPSSEQSNVVTHSETEINSDSNIIPYSHVNDTLASELKRYKEQVKVLKERQNVDLKSNDTVSNSSALFKAQYLEPKLYDGNVIKNTSVIVIPDFEETLMLAEGREPTLSSKPTKVEVPKVNIVNTSLKKLKYHLAGFDVIVKERTTPTAITEGSWGVRTYKSLF